MNSNHRFHIDLPVGWEDASVHSYLGPEINGVRHLLSVQIDDKADGASLEDYAQERIARTKAARAGLTVLKEGPAKLSDGRSIYEFVYRYIRPDDMPEFGREVFLRDGNSVVSFAGTFAKRTKETVGVQMQQMVESYSREG